MSTPTIQLEIFSDVVCPWCYIGKTKLADALERFRQDGGQVELRLRPFLLQPDFHGPSRPLGDYLAERFGDRAAQLSASVVAAGAEVGLELRMDRAIAAQTHGAHQLIESAYREGGYESQQAVADELFAAHFSRGEDIADRTVLAAAGARAGLSPAAVATAAEDPELAAAVLSSLAEAHQLGITAVPTFVADRALGIAGAQPPDTLLALMQKAAEMAGTG